MENNCEAKQKPKTVKEFFTSWHFWKPFLATFIGALAGFLYYYYIGCSSGTCAITSNPYMSIIMGGLLGLFVVNSPCSSGKC
jgi:predicted MFS family arabinose efflux permease